MENLMQSATELSDKLLGPMKNIVGKHETAIRPMLGGSEAAARAALQNDEAVRKVATFCYPLLPGLLRLAVKEPVFVNFVMNNRERVLATLVGRE